MFLTIAILTVFWAMLISTIASSIFNLNWIGVFVVSALVLVGPISLITIVGVVDSE